MGRWSTMKDAQALFQSLRSAYVATSNHLKIIDLYILFVVFTAVIQVLGDVLGHEEGNLCTAKEYFKVERILKRIIRLKIRGLGRSVVNTREPHKLVFIFLHALLLKILILLLLH